jgi:hypothetical protein
VTKTYLVQTWDDKGALTNNYEVDLAGTRDLAELKKFLKEKCAHISIVLARPKPKTR